MAKRKTDKLAVRVDPYSARPMMARGERDGRHYYRIRQAGRTVAGASGWYTPAEVRDRMLELLLGEREQKRQAEAAKRAAVEPWTVRKLMAAWVESVVRQMPASRRKSISVYEQAAFRLIEVGGDVRLDRLTRQTLTRFVEQLRLPATRAAVYERYRRAKRTKRLQSDRYADRGYAGQTIVATIDILGAAWAWAAELGHAPPRMPRKPRIVVQQRNLRRMPSREDIDRVLQHYDNLHERGPHPIACALRLQLACGARLGEIAGLRMRHVLSVEGELTDEADTRLAWVLFTGTKTHRDRRVPFQRDAAGLIADLLDASQPDARLFIHRGGPRAGHRVTSTFKEAIIRSLSRLPWDRWGVERWASHGLRDRFINDALDAGLPTDLVARCCGNSPATIYKHYRRIKDDAVIDVVARVDAIAAGENVTPIGALTGTGNRNR